jgi:hypothetical protein
MVSNLRVAAKTREDNRMDDVLIQRSEPPGSMSLPEIREQRD